MMRNIIYPCSEKAINKKGIFVIKSIIKAKSIEVSKPILIGGEYSLSQQQSEIIHKEQGEVEPILENGEVVGIVHHCQCGKSTEIRFDY